MSVGDAVKSLGILGLSPKQRSADPTQTPHSKTDAGILAEDLGLQISPEFASLINIECAAHMPSFLCHIDTEKIVDLHRVCAQGEAPDLFLDNCSG